MAEFIAPAATDLAVTGRNYKVICHIVDRYIVRLFTDFSDAKDYYDNLIDSGASRAMFDPSGYLTEFHYFYNDEWKDNIIRHLSRSVNHFDIQHNLSLTPADRLLLISKSEEGWRRAGREERKEALKTFCVHKLLCGIRHEFFFLYEREGREQIEKTTAQFAGASNPLDFLQDPHKSNTKHLLVNVIGRDNGDGKFEIENINLMDGNRRATSLTLNYIRGLLSWSAAPTLGDVHIHPLINGYNKERERYETWIPGQTLIRPEGLVDQNPRGDDDSRAMRSDIGFDSELVEENHRGRPLGQVALKLNSWYKR
jgi:hypothetical protein